MKMLASRHAEFYQSLHTAIIACWVLKNKLLIHQLAHHTNLLYELHSIYLDSEALNDRKKETGRMFSRHTVCVVRYFKWNVSLFKRPSAKFALASLSFPEAVTLWHKQAGLNESAIPGIVGKVQYQSLSLLLLPLFWSQLHYISVFSHYTWAPKHPNYLDASQIEQVLRHLRRQKGQTVWLETCKIHAATRRAQPGWRVYTNKTHSLELDTQVSCSFVTAPFKTSFASR